MENNTLQYGDISLKIAMTFGVSEYSKSLGIEGTIKNFKKDPPCLSMARGDLLNLLLN